MNDFLLPELPAHVSPSQAFAFDIYRDARLGGDIHAGFRSLHRDAPDVFFTPHNGGHWVVTRFNLISDLLTDTARFSSRELSVPKANSPYVLIPLNLDPPDHTQYRVLLMRYFSPKVVAALEGTLRGWADRLISAVYLDGQCDFTEALGAGFPVSIFMEMMGLPLERFHDFRAIVKEYFGQNDPQRRKELQAQIFAEMEQVIRQRMAEPRDDLVSRLIAEEVRGRRLTMDELLSISYLLFIAGLDTVANTLTFTFYHLAGDATMQQRLRSDPAAIPAYVDEALRRFAIVNPVRQVKEDLEFHGSRFRAGDMVVCAVPAANQDDTANPDGARFDIDRTERQLATFSIGPHLCAGHYLARAEMRVFIEEFLKRIPSFRLRDGFVPVYRPGLVMALTSLPIEWDPAQPD